MASNIDLRGQGARAHHTAQTSYLDETFLVGTPVASTPGQPTGTLVPTAAGTYDFQIGSLPAGARVLRAYVVTDTVIAGGTATLALGNAQGGAQFVAAASAFGTAGTSAALTLVASNATYVNVENTPVWARLVVSGGPLTALQADVIIEFATVHGPTSQF